MDGIELAVMTTYLHEQNDVKTYKNVEVHRVQVSQPQMIGAQEYKEVPFSFSLPGITPLTIGRGSVWIKTRVDIQSALDPTDEDRIQIIPSPAQRVVLEAVESIGFRLRETESVYAPRLRGPLPFVQEFEFVPVGGRYRGKLMNWRSPF